MPKPTAEQIKKEKAKLRKIVENPKTPIIECRLAQIAEETLMWATESTTNKPVSAGGVETYARFIREELTKQAAER